MARGRLVPGQGETLAAFLDRAIKVRKERPTYRGLAVDLDGQDGKTATTWERTLRRWKKGLTSSIDRANAEILTAVLNADFMPYVTNHSTVQDVLTQVLERLEVLETQVADLRAR